MGELLVKKIGKDYQVLFPERLEKPGWAETEEGCASIIADYLLKHSGTNLRFEGVYEPDERKIKEMAVEQFHKSQNKQIERHVKAVLRG